MLFMPRQNRCQRQKLTTPHKPQSLDSNNPKICQAAAFLSNSLYIADYDQSKSDFTIGIFHHYVLEYFQEKNNQTDVKQ